MLHIALLLQHCTEVGNWPHGTESHLVCQVCVMWQESREEVLGKSVHGNTLPVDNLTKAAERTSWTRRGGEKKIYAYFFLFTKVSKPEKIPNYVARWCSHSFTSWKKCLFDALTQANVTVVLPSSSCMACFRRLWTRMSSSSNSWSFATICSSLRHTWKNNTHF